MVHLTNTGVVLDLPRHAECSAVGYGLVRKLGVLLAGHVLAKSLSMPAPAVSTPLLMGIMLRAMTWFWCSQGSVYWRPTAMLLR